MRTHHRSGRFAALAALAAAAIIPACAALNDIVQAPQFTMDQGRSSEIRLLGPSIGRPLGGAQVRVWARVHNPNGFRLQATQLTYSLMMDSVRIAVEN